MRVLLTGPLMSYEDRWGQYAKGAGDTFPQGTGSIAGYLEKYEIRTDVIEPDILGMDRTKFVDYIKKNRYEIIGISAFTTNIVFAYETAKIIKGIDSKIKVIIGGSHPTILPIRTLEECREIDFLITNEGEIPMLELVRAIERGHNFNEVPNLYYRENEDIKTPGKKSEWLDLDALPIFPYHKFDLEKYIPAPSLRKVLPTFNYMAQRGYPYQCAFCDTTTHGKKVRYRSIDKVIDDLEYLKEKYGVRGIIFEGSNFTVSPKWIEEFCHRLIEEKLDLTWYCMGRVDLDHKLLPLMKKSGLWCMSFGIESANEKTLKRMKKNIDIGGTKKTIKKLRELKIKVTGSFILAYPGETEEDVINTINFACDSGVDTAVFFVPVPFPKTELYADVTESGGLKENIQWEDYHAWLDHNNPIYINPDIGEARQKRLYNYAFKKFYTRPSYIMKQIFNIKSFDDCKRLIQGFQKR